MGMCILFKVIKCVRLILKNCIYVISLSFLILMMWFICKVWIIWVIGKKFLVKMLIKIKNGVFFK